MKMKIKTSELIGPALDWAVAVCEELPLKLDPMGFCSEAPQAPQAGWWVWFATPGSMIVGYKPQRRSDHEGYSPSTVWAQGGPIIEREGPWVRESAVASPAIAHLVTPDKKWFAYAKHGYDGARPHCYYGEAYLIAAMRCYVASKLGDEVDVPEELLK